MFYALLIVAIASRFLPHPPNVACVAAIGLFVGCYFRGWRAVVMPAAILLGSDLLGHLLGRESMGFYHPLTMLGVYVGMTASVGIGRLLRERRGVARIVAASVVTSTIFFLLSNFGVWVASGMYVLNVSGLMSCYANALPFFQYTMLGDLAYVTVLFGAMAAYRITVRSNLAAPAALHDQHFRMTGGFACPAAAVESVRR